MRLKRLKKNKGSRWKKGQSSLANSSVTHFRQAAKSRFFEEFRGESGLTQDALAKHNKELLDGSIKLTTGDVDEDDYRSFGKSFNTFATNFTTCTIPAFEKFFQNFAVDSELHTRMLAIHAAAQEYIQEAELPETSTSYVCALMSSLQGVRDSEADVAATLSLLARVMRKVSNNILTVQFSTYVSLLYDVLKLYETSGNNILLCNLIGCLSIVLRSAPLHEWQTEFVKKVFNAICQFTLHQDPKIRKSAQYNVSAILKGSIFMSTEQHGNNYERTTNTSLGQSCQLHPAASSVGKYVREEIQLASQSLNAKRTLHLLGLSQQVICMLPEKGLQRLCEKVLGVMYIGDALVRNCSLKSFLAVFNSSKPSTLTGDMCKALLNALTVKSGSTTLVPNLHDVDLAATWIKTCTAGVAKLLRFDEIGGIEYMIRWFHQETAFWKSSGPSLHEEIYFSVDFLLDDLKDVVGWEKLSTNYGVHCSGLFQTLDNCVSLQFKAAWPFVFKSLSSAFKVFGTIVTECAKKSIKNMSQLHGSEELDAKHKPLCEHVLGAAIVSVGPQVMIEVVPFQITGNILEDEKHFWLLPILKRFVKNVRLVYFVSFFMHLAEKCSVVVQSLIKSGKGEHIITKTYQQVELQLWSLFPSFCEGSVDVEDALNIRDFPKKIRDNIRDREDLRLDILSGLRHMINASVLSGKSTKLSYFSKNYLPVLFNIYLLPVRKDTKEDSLAGSTVDNGQRLAVFETIKLFLNITKKDTVQQLFTEITKKYQRDVIEELDQMNTRLRDKNGAKYREEVSKVEFKGRCLMDLLRIHLPYVDKSHAEIVWNIVHPLLIEGSMTRQKGAYRLCESLLDLETDEGKLFLEENRKQFFDNLLRVSVTKITPSARSSRLTCLSKLLLLMPNDHQDILGRGIRQIPSLSAITEDQLATLVKLLIQDAVICFGGDNSAPTRKSAIKLLIQTGQFVNSVKSTSTGDTFSYMLSFLMQNLSSEDSLLISNTIRAVSVLYVKYHDIIPDDVFRLSFQSISVLLHSEDREITKTALRYLQVVFKVFPVNIMSSLLDDVVKNIVKMNQACKRKHRTKLRDILTSFVRKFGGDRMLHLVEEDVILSKCVKNINKQEARKKKSSKKNKPRTEEKEERAIPASLDEILEEIDRDIEDDHAEQDDEIKTKKQKKQVWITEGEDEIMDLLDSTGGQMSRKPPSQKKEQGSKVKENLTDEEKYGFKFDKALKKFIITDDADYEREKDNEPNSSDEDDLPKLEDLVLEAGGKKGKSVAKRKRTESEDSLEPEEKPTKKVKKKKKVRFDYGSEFRAKKAGGDVRSKSGLAPYAYVKLTKENLNKRKQAKYKGQFRSLVKGTKRGVAKGTKNKKRKKK